MNKKKSCKVSIVNKCVNDALSNLDTWKIKGTSMALNLVYTIKNLLCIIQKEQHDYTPCPMLTKYPDI